MASVAMGRCLTSSERRRNTSSPILAVSPPNLAASSRMETPRKSRSARLSKTDATVSVTWSAVPTAVDEARLPTRLKTLLDQPKASIDLSEIRMTKHRGSLFNLTQQHAHDRRSRYVGD